MTAAEVFLYNNILDEAEAKFPDTLKTTHVFKHVCIAHKLNIFG